MKESLKMPALRTINSPGQTRLLQHKAMLNPRRQLLLLCLFCTAVTAVSVATTSSPLYAQEGNEASKKAPDTFQVLFETTKGNFTVEVNRNWSPNGADRFHELVNSCFYNDAGFFRVVPGFVVQFGLNADPAVQKKWTDSKIKDDPVVSSNKRGSVTFAMAGPNTRTSQLFINYADNARLDDMGFSPFGTVIQGIDVVDKINSEYGQQPNQGRITAQGNAYLKSAFPNMDFITKAAVVTAKAAE